MNKSQQQREQFLRVVLMTACEGGVNYWADVRQYKPSQGFAILRDAESDGAQDLRLDLAAIAAGIERIVGNQTRISKDRRNQIFGANVDNDASDIDADLADCIAQAALLNDLVYG